MKPKARDRAENPPAGDDAETGRRTADEWLAKASGSDSARRTAEDRLRVSLATNVRHHHAINIGRAAIGIGLMAIAVAIVTLVLV